MAQIDDLHGTAKAVPFQNVAEREFFGILLHETDASLVAFWNHRNPKFLKLLVADGGRGVHH